MGQCVCVAGDRLCVFVFICLRDGQRSCRVGVGGEEHRKSFLRYMERLSLGCCLKCTYTSAKNKNRTRTRASACSCPITPARTSLLG